MSIEHDDKELMDLLAVESAREEGGGAPADWSAVLGELRAEETAAPSPGFSDSLRQAWQAEATPGGAARRRRNCWRITVPLAAAAVVAFVLLWPGGAIDSRTGGGVAWADVVKAMDRVQQFHLIAFIDDPRRADEQRRLFRYDLFYQQPNRLRTHERGEYSVGFLIGDKSYLWDNKRNEWATGSGGEAPDMMFPRDFADQLQKQGLLQAVLEGFFEKGKVPAGEPVKSDEVASSQGIDVFDYARKPSESWMRIWVLRESKLPLKMHMYMPDSDEFVLVNFDYSDPQPDAFFSPEAFAQQAKQLRSDNPQRLHSIGSTPVAGTRPRAADQIHEVEGGYRAPKIQRIASNGEGDILIVTDRVENRTPSGSYPHEQGYERITDTWGNRYLKVDEWTSGRLEQFRRYMPFPPFKRGAGPRRISMTFVVEPTYGDRVELSRETLDVPDASTASTKPNDWPQDLAQRKRFAWSQYLQHFGTLAEQLDHIDRALAKGPNVESLAWKYRLLRRHGREPQAWALFEKELRNRIFDDPKMLNQYYAEAAEYLLYLADANRIDELRTRSAAVRRLISEAQAAKGTKRPSGYYNLERAEHNPLVPASHLLEWRETFKAGPEVVRTIAGRDGLVFIELSIPKPPEGWNSNGWDGSAPYGWFWQPTFGNGWQTNAHLAKLDANRLWLVLRGEGKQIPLAGEAALALDNYGDKPTRHDAKLAWQGTIDVPEPTVDDLHAWWTKEAGNEGWWPLPPVAARPVVAQADGVEQWMAMAKTYRDAARYEHALPLFEKVIALPREQWPAMYTQGVALLEDTVEATKRQMRIGQVQCLAELGRVDDARKVAAEVWASLPTPTDLDKPLDGHIAAEVVLADIQIPRALARRGDVAAARVELDRIARHRPQLIDIRGGTIMVDRGPVKIGWNPRSKQQEAWREFDTVWWDVNDAK